MSLDHILGSLSSKPDVKGRQFERLCRWFLQNAPQYKNKLKNVWLWNDWPGRWGPDTGIDLVAETGDGDLWAVQAKAWEGSLPKSEIDSFLSESNRPEFAYRLLTATTDRLSTNALRTIEGQEKPVGLALRSFLEATDVEWPSSLDDLAPPKRAPLVPHDYQREAIENILAGFEGNDRGQLIMACGTGKTLVSLWAAEDLKSQRTLVLAPSLTLLSQTIGAWTANASRPFDYIAVCSDQTVTNRDETISRTADLAVPVTTDPDEIRRFLVQDRREDNVSTAVVFATYQSSPRIVEALVEALAGGSTSFDLVIADEAHRCTGSTTSDFTAVLDADRIKTRRRLFMTATPRYFTDRVRKAASEEDSRSPLWTTSSDSALCSID